MHPYLNYYKPEDQLEETATVLTLAFLALNMISRSKLSNGNNVPNPSLGWTSTVYNKYGIKLDVYSSNIQTSLIHHFQEDHDTPWLPAGLSLRAGGPGFSPAIKNVAPSTFIGK